MRCFAQHDRPLFAAVGRAGRLLTSPASFILIFTPANGLESEAGGPSLFTEQVGEFVGNTRTGRYRFSGKEHRDRLYLSTAFRNYANVCDLFRRWRRAPHPPS